MKTITLSVDDHTLEAVRIYGAERGTSVNALIRAFMEQLAMQQDRARAAMARLRERSEQARPVPGAPVRGGME